MARLAFEILKIQPTKIFLIVNLSHFSQIDTSLPTPIRTPIKSVTIYLFTKINDIHSFKLIECIDII